ncbi:hypothetical protein LEP1GSC058_3018 [Leptospira fainei serovar Hurstbridge str. BUT 6]|uniref:GHKL domain protein n=1 Tax=Leptospira fainei serovar Hurstbridge str. BUT 6 TaxID=1193011 RepID=S3UYD9_9LEPT|nr:hypothetical protein [Leptospira fainei]EPG74233.1 hypothetical protein LEP1GSC058_3018 [Leptospira fainei serovar Hurstbridge str. BUT 6]
MNEGIEEFSQEFLFEIETAVKKEEPVSIITYVLSNNGEAKLKHLIYSVLAKYGREDLIELLFTSAKELIVNATKAAIKRVLFRELGLNIDDPDLYDQGMTSFKENLVSRKFPYYRRKMKENGLFVKVTLSFNRNRIILLVQNNFTLALREEKRIREKFVHSKEFDNLFEYYMKYGDTTEGAGMGITMVEILVAQSGYDRHLFTIYSRKSENRTVARVEIPLNENYVPRRHRYQKWLQEKTRSFSG